MKLINILNHIQLINENYELAFQYLREEDDFFRAFGPDRLLTTGFIRRYNIYQSSFKQFSFLTTSEEFLDYIEYQYYKVKNTILNYINDKIKSIDTYYFNNELYTKYFYFLNLMNNDLYKLMNNFDNYFNDVRIESDIKTKIIQISLNEIQPYNEGKEKELENLYNNLYNRAENYKVHDTDYDFVQYTIRKKKWYKKGHRVVVVLSPGNCPHKGNVNKILTDLSKTKAYLDDRITLFINDYLNKFNIYLNNHIYYSQKLYNYLHNFYEEKIFNNNNIRIILNDYQSAFNKLIENYSNKKTLEEINNNGMNILNMKYYIEKFNTHLIEIEKYYELIYLKDSKDFLEYPEEIIFKLEKIRQELYENMDMIKKKINNSYSQRISNIMKSTISFISDFNEFNFEYIIAKINKNNIINNYYLSKLNEIKNYFSVFSNKINALSNNLYGNKNILNNNNYDNHLNNIFNNYLNFISDFEDIIEQNFTFLNCSENYTNNSIFINESDICQKEKYISDLNYSKYNFNVVKIRTELSYTKKLIEIFSSLFDGLNYDDLINYEEIKYIDKNINDKNIINIYKKATYNLEEIEKDTLNLIEEPFEEFIESFEMKNTLKDEYIPYLNDFQKILMGQDLNYINEIAELHQNILAEIKLLLDNFNNILNEQLSFRNGYDYYSINNDYFESVYENYSSQIENCFNYYNKKINNLNQIESFYHYLKINLDNIQLNKRAYLQNIIDEFSQNYEFETINFKYNLSEQFNSFLEKEYIDYEFSYVYDYFEKISTNNINIYFENINQQISNLKNNILTKLKHLYDNFMDNYKNNSHFASLDFINQLKINHTNCLNNFDALDKQIFEDLNFSNITDLDDYVKSNCSSFNIINSLLDNIDYNICLNISNLNLSIYFDDINELIICKEKKNYTSNYTIFNDFKKNYKNILDDIILNITKIINSNHIDEKYLLNYFFSNRNYSYQQITINDLYTNFEDIEDVIYYINNIKEPEYKNLLYDLFIESFNISYNKIADDYLTNEINDKLILLINDKLEIFIDYLKNHFINEYEYFSLLLNKTTELGYSSKMSIINFFSDFPKNLNETVFYFLEDDIFFNINLFFRVNKNIFLNNFIEYYLGENKYDINIYKIKNYIDEIKLDKNFNKTLSSISNNIINNLQNKVIETITTSLKEKINSFYNMNNQGINDLKILINKIITNQLPEDMIAINDLINNYIILVKNQNNKFYFRFGEAPFNLLNNFIEEEIKPPLFLIKEKYN